MCWNRTAFTIEEKRKKDQEEIHEFVRCLTNDTIFMNEHASNLFHVKCRIPEQKEELLAYIRKFMEESNEMELRKYRERITRAFLGDIDISCAHLFPCDMPIIPHLLRKRKTMLTQSPAYVIITIESFGGERMIEVYVQEIATCLKNRCYFAALALTLTLPDICGAAEFPHEASVTKRYINWYDKYIGNFERQERYADDSSYLSGEVVYNLRNTFLHQGNPTIKKDKVKAKENQFDRFFLILGDATIFWSASTLLDIGNGAATFRGMIIDVTYLCQKICRAALYYDQQNGSNILNDVLAIPQEFFTQPQNREDYKPDYSAFTKQLNEQLHQNGINVSIPESYIADLMEKMVTQSAHYISKQHRLIQYLNKISQGSISDEDKDKIINIVISSKSKQEIHSLFQKAFGNTAATEYYKMIKPLLKYYPGKAE